MKEITGLQSHLQIMERDHSQVLQQKASNVV